VTYYKDLSPFEYEAAPQGGAATLNVGWLSTRKPFSRGDTSEQFLDELFRVVQTPWISHLGYHNCRLGSCRRRTCPWGLTESRHGQSVKLGDSVVLVEAIDGLRYAAPDLIYHYVVEHSYLPPKAFVDAALARRSNGEEGSARRDDA